MNNTLSIILALLSSGISCAGENNKKPLCISGVYPHLAMYNGNNKYGGETGVGALVPWAGKLWAITYPAHEYLGSKDYLYEITPDLKMTLRPESVGGTHANRMIHPESKQLFIGSYVISDTAKVRVIPPKLMPGRLTANARHLTDPANRIYCYTMEEGLYDIDVKSLDFKTIHYDGNVTPPPGVKGRADLNGYHGKGAYTAQGRLVVSNNGLENYTSGKPAGTLSEWNGKEWQQVHRLQFTEVTGPGGIQGNPSEKDPLWALGWDEKSVILKLLDGGNWYTYRLPKASFTYDGRHGWHTEWPRIREVNDGKFLMNMHGMFWDFPKTFSTSNTAGIKPLSSYLKIVGDFAFWNDKIVLGTDDASLFDNKLVGRAQSNLCFLSPDQLSSFGPRNGRGAVWLNDDVTAGTASEPFLVSGFDRKMVHLVHESPDVVTYTVEYDAEGKGNWQKLDQVNIQHGYGYYIFPEGFKAEWVRLVPDKNSFSTTAWFEFSQKDSRAISPDAAGFTSIPTIKEAVTSGAVGGVIRAAEGEGVTLEFLTQNVTDQKLQQGTLFTITGDLQFKETPDENRKDWLTQNIEIMPDFTVDEASVIIRDKSFNKVFRLPKGDDSYAAVSFPQRGIREVATERALLNCNGTFYEVPRNVSGGLAGIKPITTHNRFIHDFCSWRGLMVISGTKKDHKPDGQYFSSNKKSGLWFGSIDDLWKLGKPVGKGGPWKNSAVKKNTPSDPYLMAGYDKKTVSLSHDSTSPVSFTLEVDITATGNYVPYGTYKVKPKETFTHTFPEGYSAQWIRVIPKQNCKATAQFLYE